METIVRDEMVAVAVSSGFGTGWSTWNDVDPMDARFNQLFLDEEYKKAADLCEQLGLGYANGAYDVVIRWVPEGTKFRIDEYDGSESLVTEDQDPWRIA